MTAETVPTIFALLESYPHDREAEGKFETLGELRQAQEECLRKARQCRLNTFFEVSAYLDLVVKHFDGSADDRKDVQNAADALRELVQAEAA